MIKPIEITGHDVQEAFDKLRSQGVEMDKLLQMRLDEVMLSTWQTETGAL